MSLENSHIPNLINGVSQQAEKSRFPSQAEEQINGLSNPVQGLQKRPPTEHIAKLYNAGVDTSDDNAFYHFINRSTTEQYLIVIRGGLAPYLEVFDMEGNSQDVLDSEGIGALTEDDKTYLATSTPASSLEALTIGDSTFFLNKDITPEMDTALSTSRDPEALVFIRRSHNSTYRIYLSNTPGGSTTYTATYIAASGASYEAIANGLVLSLNAVDADDDYLYFLNENLIHIKKKDGSDFEIQTRQDNGPEYLSSIKDTVSSLSDLPKNGYFGFEVEIKGAADTVNENSYYVKFVNQQDEDAVDRFGEGIWEETAQGGIEYQLDSSLMPHRIVSNGIDFRFGPNTWTERTVGDDDSSPAPSFVSNGIDGMFFFKNRLGMLSRENAILSEDGEFFNFFRTSVIDLLDADPIDITVGGSAQDVVFLKSAIPREDELLVFSEDSQFIISSEEAFTASSVSATLVSRTSALPNVSPIHLDNAIYFPFQHGTYSGITEYLRTDQFQPFQSEDITSHVPNYIRGTATQLRGIASENLLICKADGERDTLYCYNYLDIGTERPQSAWHKWTFSGEVRTFFFVQSTLYLIVDYGDQTDLVKMDIYSGATDAALDHKIFIDRRLTQAEVSDIVYSSVTGKTTFTLPFTPVSGDVIQVCKTDGTVVATASNTGAVVSVGEDLSSTDFFVGSKYIFTYKPTRPALRSTRADGRTVPNVKFRPHFGVLAYDDSASFYVEVEAQSTDTATYVFDSKELGTAFGAVGAAAPLSSGDFVFPVHQNPKYVTVSIVNDSPLPCNLLNLTWEGDVKRRATTV